MNPIWALLIVAATSGAAIAALLLVRRNSPEGSYFADGDRAAGGFGVLATGFSVLLGFIIFLAFTSYDNSRVGAEAEALAVSQQFETAQFLPGSVRSELSGELACYARTVVHQEWPALESGAAGDEVNPWGVEMFRTLKTVAPRSAAQGSAYDHWLDRTAEREEARRDRIHGAVGVIPGPLWVVLLFIAVITFAYMLFFADRAERARSQAMLIGSVIGAFTAMLLLIQYLDDPYREGFGGLRPVAMERTIGILEQERQLTGETGPLPCDASGKRV